MQIEKKHIKRQIIIGSLANGTPIVYIETHGGLHAVFANRSGKIEAIAAMPHKAMAVWMAEKKLPEAQWDKQGLSEV